MRRLIEEWGIQEMTVGYGLTEASPGVCFTRRTDPLEVRCQTVGLPTLDTELRLVDPEGGSDGERGELWVRGEQVMLGYYKDAEATAEVITAEGWLKTGDLAERDRRGNYRIVGRIKDMICRGGENIYPAEVEEAIRQHPAVAEVAVFGIPDARLGEQLACAIVPVDQGAMDGGALREYLRGRIARVKIPHHVEIVSELPLTPSGKIQRHLLSKQFAERAKGQEAPSKDP